MNDYHRALEGIKEEIAEVNPNLSRIENVFIDIRDELEALYKSIDNRDLIEAVKLIARSLDTIVELLPKQEKKEEYKPIKRRVKKK